MKKIFFALVVMIVACFFVSCSEYDKDYVYDGTSIIGRWQERDFDDDLYKIYEFRSDGTVSSIFYIKGIVTSARLEGNIQEYRIEGNNTLVLIDSYNNGENKVENRIQFSIDENKKLVLHSNGDDINVLVPYSLKYDVVSPIAGKWINETVNSEGKAQNDLFWFLENGQCMIFSDVSGEIGDDVDEFTEKYIESDDYSVPPQSMLYATTNEGKIHLCFSSEVVVSKESIGIADYTVQNGKLIISTKDGQVEFVRLEDDFV